jgi:hypothetical protein
VSAMLPCCPPEPGRMRPRMWTSELTTLIGPSVEVQGRPLLLVS